MFSAKKHSPRGRFSRNSDEAGGGFVYQPARFCPQIKWLDENRIQILEGGLANRELEVKTELLPKSAAIYLYDQKEIGKVLIERNPPGTGIILWDALVHPDYRQKGLAGIMTWIIFRRLLEEQDYATFTIRMVRHLKPVVNGTELQNVGMGVIAVRLGFTPEINLEKLLRPSNIISVDLFPESQGTPPGLRLVLHSDPLILIMFVLNPETMRPIKEERVYNEIKRDLRLVHSWANLGLLVVNGNYLLRTPQIDHFVNRMAINETEARIFRDKIRGL